MTFKAVNCFLLRFLGLQIRSAQSTDIRSFNGALRSFRQTVVCNAPSHNRGKASSEKAKQGEQPLGGTYIQLSAQDKAVCQECQLTFTLMAESLASAAAILLTEVSLSSRTSGRMPCKVCRIVARNTMQMMGSGLQALQALVARISLA